MWKLEGLSDYDVRRPLTSTGTNLLGLVTDGTKAFWKQRYAEIERVAQTWAD